MSPPRKKKPKPKEPKSYGRWQFGRDFLKGIFALLNSGRIYPAFGLLILSIMGLVVLRLPETELAEVAKLFLLSIRSSYGLVIAMFIASNLGWLYLFTKQKRMYDDEISRIAQIRQELMHLGVNIQTIKHHRSSSEEQTEGYILPNVPGKQRT